MVLIWNGGREMKNKEIHCFLRVQSYLKPYLFQYIIFVLIAGFSQFLTFLFVGNLLKEIVASVNTNSIEFSFSSSLLYLLLVFLFTCLMAFGVYEIKKIEEKIRMQIRKEMMHAYIMSDEMSASSISSKEIMNRLSIDLMKVVELVGWIIAGSIYMPVISGIVSLIYLTWIDYRISLLCFALSLIGYLMLTLFREKRKEIHEKTVIENNEILKTLVEERKGKVEVITFGLLDVFERKLKSVTEKYHLNNRTYTMLNGIRMSASQFYLECVINLVLLIAGAILASKNVFSFANVVIAIALLDQISQMIFAISGFQVMLKEYAIYEDRVFEILDLPQQKNYLKIIANESIIEFENVSFSYGEKQVLNSITLSIKPHEKIAIVGESGCGKSTLLKLLLGLYSSTSGCIKLQKDVTVSYVPQSAPLLNKTVKENIAVDENCDLEKMMTSVKSADAHEFIEEKGYENIVTTDSFSGGQKARILIARAIYNDADIVVLDEPTSALDQQTSENVMQTLFDMKEKTAIVVTHRLLGMEKYDRVIFLKKGTIAGIGKHYDLLRENSAYSDFCM